MQQHPSTPPLRACLRRSLIVMACVLGLTLGVDLTPNVSLRGQIVSEISGQATTIGGNARLAIRF